MYFVNPVPGLTICATGSTLYDSATDASTAPAQSYASVVAAQTPVYTGPFTCDKICPPGEFPGCDKANKYVGYTSVTVTAVAAPSGKWYSKTCYTGTTRSEGCMRCIRLRPL